MNPDNDREEVERRSQLARFVPCLAFLTNLDLNLNRSLEDIGTRSLDLSKKGKVARVLDKSQDSQEVVRLVERLRQAILIYQVSAGYLTGWKSLTRGTGVTTTVDIQPGRSIDRESLPSVFDSETQRAIGQPKASFDVLLKLHQVREYVHAPRRRVTRLQKSPVKNKIESVRARLDRIGKEGDAAMNSDEFKRRKILFECVFSNCRQRPSTAVHANPVSGLLKGSRTSCGFYLGPPVPLGTQRTKGT